MPVDRLLTIGLDTEGSYSRFGEFEPGPLTVLRKWATIIDTSVTRTIDSGGARGDADLVVRLRYTSGLMESPISRMSAWDEDGASYTVSRRDEETGRDGRTRRRWVELELSRDTTRRPIPAPPLEPSEPIDGMTPVMMPDMMGLTRVCISFGNSGVKREII